MQISELFRRQDELQAEALLVREDLRLDEQLSAIGTVVPVGSAALGLMVWRDLDITVICGRLDVAEVAQAGASLALHDRVNQVLFRNDTGTWNIDPGYPDGLYLGPRYRTPAGDGWNVDIWFVDEPDRQPDLAHVSSLPARLSEVTRASILRVKHDWAAKPEYGKSITSYDIYRAVLDDGVRTPAGFEDWLTKRTS